MTDDIQAKLRAQAKAVPAELFAETAVAIREHSLNREQYVYNELIRAFRLGQSAERARQQGLIAKWRNATYWRSHGPMDCADELESTR